MTHRNSVTSAGCVQSRTVGCVPANWKTDSCSGGSTVNKKVGGRKLIMKQEADLVQEGVNTQR